MPVWVEPRLVRAGGCYWLAQLGPRAAACAERLRKLGNDDLHPEVRQSALWALGRVDAPTKESLSALIRGLATDPDAAVRRIAAGGLEIWKADDPRVIPSLIQALSDSDPSVQQISAAALGRYGRRALPAMEPLKKLAAAGAIASDYAARAMDEINQDTAAMTSPAK